MERIQQTDDSPYTIIIRIMVGMVFVSEGIQKFLFPGYLGSGRFERIGIPWHEVMGPVVGGVEITAGLLVLAGLVVRPAAMALLTIMLTAIVTTKIPILLGDDFLMFKVRELKRYGVWSMLHESRTDWSMLLGSFYLLLAGGGRWSLDAELTRDDGDDQPSGASR